MPSPRLQSATILEHDAAGRGYYRLLLQAPEIAGAAVPGQFVMLRVTENLDPLLARPFGIASVVENQSIEIYYRVAGKGTDLLTRCKPGLSLSLLGPLGKGFPQPEEGMTSILVAGGSGFPPLLYFSLQYGAGAHFFTGARNSDCLPPDSVLDRLAGHVEKIHVATDDGGFGLRGTTADMLTDFLSTMKPSSGLMIYACGPHAMLAAVSRIAANHVIPCYVSMEERMACGLGACMGCSVPVKAGGYKRVCQEGPVFDARDIEWAERVPVVMKR